MRTGCLAESSMRCTNGSEVIELNMDRFLTWPISSSAKSMRASLAVNHARLFLVFPNAFCRIGGTRREKMVKSALSEQKPSWYWH